MPLVIEVKVEDGQVTAKMRDIESTINKIDSAGKKTSSTFSGLSKMLGSFYISFAALRGVRNTLKMGVEVESSFLKLKAITGATASEMQRLEMVAKKLGRTTTYTISEVVRLQIELGKLGFASGEISRATKGILQMAQATGTELAQAAEITGTVLRAFNLDAGETGRVADNIVQGINRSALTIDHFANSMKYVAPIAAQFNISIEEATAYLAALADRGIKGSLAGTSLRYMFLRLAGPTSLASRHLEGMNLRTSEFTEILDKANKTVARGAEGQKIWGLRASAAAAILSGLGTEGLKEYIRVQEEANGKAQETANIMTSGWYGAIKRLTSAWQELTNTIFESGKESKTLLDVLTMLVLKLRDLYIILSMSDWKELLLAPFQTIPGWMGLPTYKGEGADFLKEQKYLEKQIEDQEKMVVLAEKWRVLIDKFKLYQSAVPNTKLPNMFFKNIDIKDEVKYKLAEKQLERIYAKYKDIIDATVYFSEGKGLDVIAMGKDLADALHQVSDIATKNLSTDFSTFQKNLIDTMFEGFSDRLASKVDADIKKGLKTLPPGIAGIGDLPSDDKTKIKNILDTEFGKDKELFMKSLMEGGSFQQALSEVEKFDRLGEEGFQGLVKQIDKYMNKMKLAVDITTEFGQALGMSLVQGNLSSFKEFLRSSLLLIVNYIEKLALAALAAAGFKAILGDWGAIARVLGVMLAFETAKGSIMAFKEGGINSTLYNGKIGKNGLISGPGSGTSDSILARFSNGEAILNAETVRRLGSSRIDYMNNFHRMPAFAMGGVNNVNNETFTGNITMNFSSSNIDPFQIFRSTKDYIRKRRKD